MLANTANQAYISGTVFGSDGNGVKLSGIATLIGIAGSIFLNASGRMAFSATAAAASTATTLAAVYGFDGGGTGAADSGISRLGAASLAIGNGTALDFTGALTLGALTQNNNTVATVSTTNASPLHTLSANYWTGSASAQDLWTIGSSLAAGTNGASTLSIVHAGSTGLAAVSVPAVIAGAGTPTAPTFRNSAGAGMYFVGGQITISTASVPIATFSNDGSAYLYLELMKSVILGWSSIATATADPDSGISRLGTASLAVGNGTASNTSGQLSLAVVRNTGFTVALLPSTAATGMVEGAVAYATNGLKVGETTGNGTGVPVYYSNGHWRVYSTDLTVAA